MQVLMHVRPDWRTHKGGDLVQIQRWTAWLQGLGVRVTVSDADRPDLAGVDLVHFHNLGRAFALWPALQHCKKQGIPCVLTPLYWPTEEFERNGRPGLLGMVARCLPSGCRSRLKSLARYVRNPSTPGALLREFWHGSDAFAQRFLSSFDALILCSNAEACQVHRRFPAAAPMHIVEGGVDAFYWSSNRDLWSFERQPLFPGETREGWQDDLYDRQDITAERRGVLCVARFDPQKAQHRLIRALEPLGVPLTLVGTDNPNYPRYRRYCERHAGPHVTILPRQSEVRLKNLYRSCKVFALCSWYEISALSGLEAGCCGARVVMTERGGWKDYGSDLAWYADPASLDSIREAVCAALASADEPRLRQRIVRRFTWELSAGRLARAYQSILAQNGASTAALSVPWSLYRASA